MALDIFSIIIMPVYQIFSDFIRHYQPLLFPLKIRSQSGLAWSIVAVLSSLASFISFVRQNFFFFNEIFMCKNVPQVSVILLNKKTKTLLKDYLMNATNRCETVTFLLTLSLREPASVHSSAVWSVVLFACWGVPEDTSFAFF